MKLTLAEPKYLKESIAIMTRCINAPLRLMIAYAKEHTVPPNRVLRKYFSCLVEGEEPTAEMDGADLDLIWGEKYKVVPTEKYKEKFALAAQSVMGQNAFMASPREGSASIIEDIAKAPTEEERLQARLMLILTNQFIKEDVPALRESLYNRNTYKGVSALDAKSKYVLTSVLNEKVNYENAGRLLEVKILKGFTDGAFSCFMDKKTNANAAKAITRLWSVNINSLEMNILCNN